MFSRERRPIARASHHRSRREHSIGERFERLALCGGDLRFLIADCRRVLRPGVERGGPMMGELGREVSHGGSDRRVSG